MFIQKFIVIVYTIIMLAVVAVGIYVLVLIIKALKKYIGSNEVRQEKKKSENLWRSYSVKTEYGAK